MGETNNISLMANLISDEIFSVFCDLGWKENMKFEFFIPTKKCTG